MKIKVCVVMLILGRFLVVGLRHLVSKKHSSQVIRVVVLNDTEPTAAFQQNEAKKKKCNSFNKTQRNVLFCLNFIKRLCVYPGENKECRRQLGEWNAALSEV